MSIGYSARLIRLNKEADKCSLGVVLGGFCIKQDIPVMHVAIKLGVSRQTVYNWFIGSTEPNEQTAKGIKTFLASTT